MLVKRMQIISDKLEAQGNVDVKTLSKELKVTEKTIRQDLIKMEKMGLLERVHGGAVLKVDKNSIFPVKDRRKMHTVEKELIAKAAEECIEDGDIIILDNGTTTLELAKLIKKKRIIVITNDALIANELLFCENITLYVTGGRLKRDSNYSFIGPDTERMLRYYNANKLFLGTSSINFEQGLMTFASEEAEVKKAMIKSAKEVIALVDYTKFNKLAFVTFADIHDINTIITDSRISKEEIKRFEDEGIVVKVV